ncbi:Pentatricopeptide repeat-containing protein [Vitis vinifera]|uniref:Pentatricopeptide repeat-containing protein n=1 Tax=Vitis vinifera TaxID=29760 RepID=A0A438BP47_VITVI|nr:Pentatricopeptide repeat-containing protein [Vitis vinifera]
MEGKTVRKEPGLSWIKVGNQVHEFASRGQQHLEREAICARLEELVKRLTDLGYVPQISLALHDIEDENKEEQLYYHKLVDMEIVVGDSNRFHHFKVKCALAMITGDKPTITEHSGVLTEQQISCLMHWLSPLASWNGFSCMASTMAFPILFTSPKFLGLNYWKKELTHRKALLSLPSTLVSVSPLTVDESQTSPAAMGNEIFILPKTLIGRRLSPRSTRISMKNPTEKRASLRLRKQMFFLSLIEHTLQLRPHLLDLPLNEAVKGELKVSS